MPLIKINHNYMISLRKLGRICLKFIYDNKNMTFKEIDAMQQGIMVWDQNKFKTDNQEYFLQRLGMLLKKNDDGKLERRKKLFADKKIDYLKFHRAEGGKVW